MPSLSERTEAAYDRAIEERTNMLHHRRGMDEIEAEVKLAHADEWASAKNNDVRAVLLAGWLADNRFYQHHRPEYQAARDDYRLALLEIERLRLLVEAAKVEGGRP